MYKCKFECEICQGTYWTYNMKIHYEQSHNHITVPKNVNGLERVAVLKMFQYTFFID